MKKLALSLFIFASLISAAQAGDWPENNRDTRKEKGSEAEVNARVNATQATIAPAENNDWPQDNRSAREQKGDENSGKTNYSTGAKPASGDWPQDNRDSRLNRNR